MEQRNLGKFISKLRKEKELTQEEYRRLSKLSLWRKK